MRGDFMKHLVILILRGFLPKLKHQLIPGKNELFLNYISYLEILCINLTMVVNLYPELHLLQHQPMNLIWNPNLL